jgi:UDP-N-acetylmuramyl pentapeptide phosphotransferase/UDP-N-acetylglucosamine-1-phosphate transferase
MFRAAIFFLAGVVSYLVTGWLANGPARLRALDIPNGRSSHTRPMPRMGGLGIVAAFGLLLPLLWVMLLPKATNWIYATKLGIALLSYIVIAGVGLIDDLRRIGPLAKYLGQLGAALITIWSGVIFLHLNIPYAGTMMIGWLAGSLMTIIWLTGFSNFFNFMDGIDGLAGGIGVIYSLALAVICIGTGHRMLGAGSLMLAAACLGFLAHNFPPAKIFMGDVGSLFIGYVLAAFAVLTTNSGEQPAPFMAILLIYGTFIYDAAFTIFRRWQRGEKLYEAHRSHLYQRLVIAGQSHRRVSLTYYALSVALSAGGIIYTFAGDFVRIVVLILSAALLAAFTVYVYWYEASSPRQRRLIITRRFNAGKGREKVASRQ